MHVKIKEHMYTGVWNSCSDDWFSTTNFNNCHLPSYVL